MKKIKLKIIIPAAAALFCLALFLINSYVVSFSGKYIIKSDRCKDINADCVIILGAGVYSNNTPSPMLKDRLDTAIKLYKDGAVKKMIMTGDHGTKEYDEVNVMKDYAEKKGVPSEDIFMDHAGFSTYESMYRAKEIFCVKSAIAVTQQYHLYRAVYDGRKLGLKIYGTATPERIYGGEAYYGSREILARLKDFFVCVFKPKPKFLGETIPVSGDGNITNDQR